MDIASLVFRHAVMAAHGSRRSPWAVLRRGLIRWGGDPTCTMPIHGRSMQINLSHGLPIYQAHHPYYDSLPGRLGQFLRSRHGALTGVDVGANIGDSVAAFLGDKAQPQDRFIAVEPNPKFFSILRRNWAQDPRVVPVSVLCSAGSQQGNFSILEKNGTASIVESGSGTAMQAQPLDQIVAAHAGFAATNLIKVDTDGHDFEVLAGAVATIARNHPAVLFECDVFGRTDYTQAVLRTLDMFAAAAYVSYLVYDNLGFLLGRYSLHDHAAIKALLFYQLTSKGRYFDVLAMAEPDLADFHAAEVRFFAEERVVEPLRGTAMYAAATAAGGGA